MAARGSACSPADRSANLILGVRPFEPETGSLREGGEVKGRGSKNSVPLRGSTLVMPLELHVRVEALILQ